MKKFIVLYFTLILILLLAGCGKKENETIEIKKQVWTQDMLYKVNKSDFSPSNPQKGKVIIVGSNQTQAKDNLEINQAVIQEQGMGILNLVDDLYNLKAMSNPREDTKYLTFEKLLKENKLENIEFQNAENPNDARIKFEFIVRFTNGGKFNSPSKLVDVYNSEMEISAFDLTNGEKLSSVIVKNSAGSDIKFPDDVGDVYFMDYPDLTTKGNSKLLFDFFMNIKSN